MARISGVDLPKKKRIEYEQSPIGPKPSKSLAGVMLLLAAYIVLSSLWSANAFEPLRAAALLLLVMAVFPASSLVDGLNALQLHRCARGVAVGLAIGLCFVLFEYLTDMKTMRTMAEYFPKLHGKAQLNYFNKNAAMLVLYSWPALLIFRIWMNKNLFMFWGSLFIIGMMLMLYHTESDAARLAFVVGLSIFALSYYRSKFAINMSYSFWAFTIVMVIPLIWIMSASGLKQVASLPYSSVHRLVIWDYTASQTAKNPLLGIGVRSSRYEKEKKPLYEEVRPGKKFLKKGWHPHNMYLQAWYELGAVGAAFLLAFGVLLLRTIARLDNALQPYALATFASAATVAGLSWGMWQPWILSAFAWAAIFLLVAFRYARYGKNEQPSAAGQ